MELGRQLGVTRNNSHSYTSKQVKGRKLESEKGRRFQEQAYREEASTRPLFLTLKLAPTGSGRAEAGGMRTEASGWCMVKVRVSLPLS